MKFAPEKLTVDFVAFRRATFFGAILGSTILGTWLLWRTFRPDGISVLEGVQLVLFVLLFQQIATGFWLASFGFITKLVGGDRAQITRSIDDEPTLDDKHPPTAIILPIYNEDVQRVFRGVESMWRGLHSAGSSEGFDFFILSDSNKPESWVQEELAWLDLCKRLDGFGRIFYRKRRAPRNGKSGNVADFCRRWGARYRYMIVLDADSVMTGGILRRLVAMMERNPRVGLIQTAPQLSMGRTLFRRMQQFASKVYAPLFAAGSNYWHLFGANYWGHNAIIRVRPFIEHCDLPDLPEKEIQRRHILSHDTVEAALMRRAGYDVWFAYSEEGSYEEGPPNLSDSLARDRRWCQGNLQHFWFLFAPKIDFANRFHIWMGVMAYLSSILWFIFLVLGAVDLAIKYRSSMLSALPGAATALSGGAVTILLTATLALLFVPKLLSLAFLIGRAKSYGGALRMIASTLIETLIWTLLAPVMMLYYSRFVIMNLLGLQVKWAAQNRSEDDGLSFGQSLRVFWFPPLLGIAATAAFLNYAPHEILLLSPILLGWLLAPVLAWFTSSPILGDKTRAWNLFKIPEEDATSRPEELRFVEEGTEQPSEEWKIPHAALAQTVVDPYTHAVHLTLLRQRKTAEDVESYRKELRERLLEHGPEQLKPHERWALLWDADSLRWLHHEFWRRPAANLHPWWRERLGEAIRRVGLPS